MVLVLEGPSLGLHVIYSICTTVDLTAFPEFFELGPYWLVVIMAYFTARGIALPLVRVVDFANGLARGEIGRQMDVTSRDEFGEMAQALNRIPASLSKMIGEIEISTLDIVCGRLRRRSQPASGPEQCSGRL